MSVTLYIVVHKLDFSFFNWQNFKQSVSPAVYGSFGLWVLWSIRILPNEASLIFPLCIPLICSLPLNAAHHVMRQICLQGHQAVDSSRPNLHQLTNLHHVDMIDPGTHNCI